MKKSRFTEEQIIGFLKEGEAGFSEADIYRSSYRSRYISDVFNGCRLSGFVTHTNKNKEKTI